MSNVLFLGMPSHGHVNPTLGLVSELIKQGEKVVYFAAEPFREKIEDTGAQFKAYKGDLDIFTPKNGQVVGKPGGLFTVIQQVMTEAPEIISDILMQTKDIKFDYIIHSAAFLFTKPIVQILNIPAISSLAVFAGLRHFSTAKFNQFPGAEAMTAIYLKIAALLEDTYKIKMPEDMMELLLNKSELNLVYTSKFFVPDPDFFDDSYKFVGPPIFPRKENLDFPFEKLEGRQVLYISLGTVFGNFNPVLYDTFFQAFATWPGLVIMAAYKVDLSAMAIPSNFIIRDYVPQSALLKYISVAITHAGMNSISDLINAEVPFICIPLGADQPLLAKRAQELGATISLDINDINSEKISKAVKSVCTDQFYLTNIQKIAQSFREAGGYPKAVDEIFRFKEAKVIL